MTDTAIKGKHLMDDLQKYIDAKALDTAAYSMERFAAAAHSVSDALEGLDGHPHGGIEFMVAGEVMKLTVKPPLEGAK